MNSSMLSAVELFLLHLPVEKGLINQTIKEEYKRELYDLCTFIDKRGLNDWGELKYYDLKYYKNHLLAERKVNPILYSSRIRYIKNFFRFLYERRLINKRINYANK